MAVEEPSRHWLPAERLALIAELAGTLRTIARQWEVTREQVFDVCERINLIASMPEEYLEENREWIVHGMKAQPEGEAQHEEEITQRSA